MDAKGAVNSTSRYLVEIFLFFLILGVLVNFLLFVSVLRLSLLFEYFSVFLGCF